MILIECSRLEIGHAGVVDHPESRIASGHLSPVWMWITVRGGSTHLLSPERHASALTARMTSLAEMNFSGPRSRMRSRTMPRFSRRLERSPKASR